MDDASQSCAEVRHVLANISTAWQARRYDVLAEFFAEDMILALPASGARLEGVRAVIESYREFMDRVTLTNYREDPATVDVWVNTAVASYRWEMSWLAGNTPNREVGHDIFVFRRTTDERWLAVWRTMMFEPSAPAPDAPAA